MTEPSGPASPGQPGPWAQQSTPPAWPPAYEPPAGYGGYPPPQPRGTNGFAIAALVLGIIAVIPLAVIFGIVALVQTRTSGQSGRGLAVAALVLSGLWAALVVVGIVVVGIVAAVSAGAGRGEDGQITGGGSVSATALRTGDCVNDLQDSTTLLSLPAVPCTDPHEGEVIAVFDLPAGDYPGAAAVDEQVDTECSGRLGVYAPSASTDPSLGLFSVYPLEANWRAGDREVVCIASSLGGPTTGSLRGR